MTVTDRPSIGPDPQARPDVRAVRKVRLPELDVIRVVASLVVVVWHYTFSSWASLEQPAPELRFDGAFSQVVRHLFFVPQLFFMISGFVIATTAQHTSAWLFLRGRVLRVVPVFWLMCTITWLVSRNDPTFGPQSVQVWALNMSFLTSIAGGPFVDAVYWTLTVEIVFYALVWMVIAAGRMHQLKGLVLAWLAVGLAVEAIAMGHGGALGHLGFLMRWNCCFAAGICCWLLQQDRHDRFARRLLPLLAVLSARAVWLVADQFRAHLKPGVTLDGRIGAVLVVIGLAGLVALAVHGPTGRISERAALRWGVLGGLTYPVYLLHENVGLIAMHRLAGVDKWILVLGAIAVVVAVSWAVVVWFERPVLRYLKRIVPATLG